MESKPSDPMNCDPRIAELLPWYVNGTLKDAERKLVEEHLKHCSKCQNELARIRWVFDGVREYGGVLLSGHIDPGKLTQYVEAPGRLFDKDRAIIEAHLERCADCRQELELLRRSAEDFGVAEGKTGPVSLQTRTARWPGSILDGLSWLVRKPAFAYLIVLLLIYPAYLGLRTKHPRLFDQVVLSTKELILTEQIRGTAQEVPEIRFASPGILRLSIPYPIDTTFGLGYEATISDGKGKVIWRSEDWRQYDAADGQLFWVFELNTLNLPSGPIEVGIRKYLRGEPSTYPTVIYRFRLID